MVRTQVQLTENQARELKSMAARQGVSMAALVRRSVDRMLLVERVPDEDEVRRRAIAAAGRIHSGTGDLAARHDDYAAEAYTQ
jgi:16S rRNA U516 pseudouridylate synthase RsuA-like enzyme